MSVRDALPSVWLDAGPAVATERIGAVLWPWQAIDALGRPAVLAVRVTAAAICRFIEKLIDLGGAGGDSKAKVQSECALEHPAIGRDYEKAA